MRIESPKAPIFAYSLAFACAFVVWLSPAFCEGAYLPPNPITPPVVSPPSYAPDGTVSPVAPPVVSAPEVSGVSISPADRAGKAAAQSNKVSDPTKKGGAKAGIGTAGTSAAGLGTAGADATGNGAVKGNGRGELPKDLNSVSALTLLGLAGDNPLMGALTGTSAEAGGIDALTSLLSGSAGDAGDGSAGSGGLAGSAALEKTIALMARERAQAPSTAREASVPERVVSGGEIARFSINGSDVAKSVTTVVSSAIARDGSLLITGDRTYAGSDRWLTETFYLLIRKTGTKTYELYADVAQREQNPNSFLYRLARKTPIAGGLEGDLIVFSSRDRDLRLDLAIRLFSASVGAKKSR